MSVSSPILVALDYPDAQGALNMANQLDPSMCRVKVGKELFTRSGPYIVEELQSKGFEVFLDLKFHDIPNTTAQAVRAAAELGVWMVNVHASGGRKMMEACANVLSGFDKAPLLIGVTVLTSMAQEDMAELGIEGSIEDHVLRLGALAKDCGLDGLVCSAQEVRPIRNTIGSSLQLVTPGIRPSFATTDDQKRIMTPSQAIEAGSNYLVIGRPITKAENPLEALDLIQQELAGSN